MDSPPMTTSPRHRLMCSYGGKIMPRPQTKSLYYSGGENRMVNIPAAAISTLTLSSLTAHLSAFLNLASPFVLKYQLPHQDLDSLISISTDDDLQIMLEENIRLSSASTPSRIRLFLFPVVESVKTELTHPKRESWFDDALRSARVGFGGEINGEQESVALETSSSFGSTSSSHSLSNLPPIKASPDSIPSDDFVGSAVSTVQIGICQELVDPIAAMENLVSPNSFDSENIVADASSGIEPQKTIQVSGFQANIMGSAHKQAPYVHEGSHFIPQNMPGSQQVSPYYNVYHPLPHQQPLHYQPNQQPLNYQPNQQYPLYYLPIVQTPPIVSTPPVVPAPPIVPTPPVVPAQPVVPTQPIVPAQPVVSTQSYNMPVQYGMVQASSIGSGQPQTHLNATLLPPQQVIKEVAASPQPLTELTTPAYKNIPGGNPLIHVPYTETETRLLGVQIQHQPQAFGVVAGETANYTNKLDDDPARVQLYKSQPPPPMLS